MKRILKKILYFSTVILIGATIVASYYLIESHTKLVIAAVVIDIVLFVICAEVYEEDDTWIL